MHMETVVRNVRDLDQTDRSALERVVGHELGDGQQVVIQVVPVSGEYSEAEETAAAGVLDRILPSNEELRAFAACHRPPDEWFDYDEQRPF
jgi:hypothetical protein